MNVRHKGYVRNDTRNLFPRSVFVSAASAKAATVACIVVPQPERRLREKPSYSLVLSPHPFPLSPSLLLAWAPFARSYPPLRLLHIPRHFPWMDFPDFVVTDGAMQPEGCRRFARGTHGGLRGP